MITINDLPDDLRRLVEEFVCENGHLSNSEEANGLCTAMTSEFYQLLKANGFSPTNKDKWYNDGHCGSEWWWKGYKHPWDEGKIKESFGPVTPHNFFHDNGWAGHVCALVGASRRNPDGSSNGYFIDFTASQFKTGAPFPLIWKQDASSQ